MPLFPLPPVLVIGFLAMAIASQETAHQMVVGTFVLVALVYYFGFIRPRDLKEEKENNAK